MSSTERVAKHRLEKHSYAAGYARQPFDRETMDEAAWGRGLWQVNADSGLYDLAPMGAEIPGDPKPHLAKKGKK